MKERRHRFSWFVLAALVASCSAPASNGSGSDVAVDDSDSSTPDAGMSQTLPELDEGIYAGWATDDADVDATLGLWADEDGFRGGLVIEQEDAFEIVLTDEHHVVRPVDGACAQCPDTEWSVTVTRDAEELQLDLVAPGELSPGFAGLVMVPHDGFKPERAPGPDVEVFAGAIVAVEPAFTEAPTIDADCELAIRTADDTVESLACSGLPLESPWFSTVADSWARDADRVSLVVAAESARLGWIGTVSGDDGRRLEGTIHRLADGEAPEETAPIVGRFALERIP